MTPDPSDAAPMTGGCQCGALRFAVSAPPEHTTLCHCRMCQKAVGQPFAAYATVKQAHFAWTRGTPAAFRSSSIAERLFCPRCGTSLAIRDFDEDDIDLAVGAFDQPERLIPSAHVGVEGRVPWMAAEVFAALPERRTQSEGPNLRAMVSFQHPDRETPAGWRAGFAQIAVSDPNGVNSSETTERLPR